MLDNLENDKYCITIPFDNICKKKNNNNKVAKKIDLKLTEERIKEVIRKNFNDAKYLLTLCFVSGYINDALSYKYDSLNNKWYIFAFNAMSNDMIIVANRLLSSGDSDYSLYNLLRYLAIKENLERYITENEDIFRCIIDEFNKDIVPIYDTIKKLRNRCVAHITKCIFDKDKEKTLGYSTEKIIILVNFVFLAIKELSKIFDIQDIDYDYQYLSECNDEIKNFIKLLDQNGNLQSNS